MPLKFENDFSAAFQIYNIQPVIMDELADAGGHIPAPGPFHPVPTNRIIQDDQKLHVHLGFGVKGLLAKLLPNTCTWKATVYFEQYGRGEANPGEYTVSEPHVSAFSKQYDLTVTIPENALKPGLYEVAVSVTFEGPGGIPLPPAGFAKLGNLNVYRAA